MKSQGYSLPSYPVLEDMWDKLKEETRPIIVYGMGNGADKLFDRLNKYGVTPADIFASDGFVRGQVFHGMRVKSFSEIKEAYSDFVILLSFASTREEVLDFIVALDKDYDLYIPDMPVAGEEYFDREFYNNHYEEIVKAYGSLCDEVSKRTFASVISYKLTGKLSYLLECVLDRDGIYSLLGKDIRVMVDCGAYNGDTAREGIKYFPNLSKIYAIEPDEKTFKRLLKFTKIVETPEILPINAAAWSNEGVSEFQSGGNRNSSVNSTSSYENKTKEVRLISVDSLGAMADYIKYDVEGAELEALIGSDKTIREHMPNLLVSVYHRSADIFSLVNYLKAKYPLYKLYMRRLACVPAWELNLILIKDA